MRRNCVDIQERWDDAFWFREWMAEIDAEIRSGEDQDDSYLAWFGQDRQRRVDAWAAAITAAGLIPPRGWEKWVN